MATTVILSVLGAATLVWFLREARNTPGSLRAAWSQGSQARDRAEALQAQAEATRARTKTLWEQAHALDAKTEALKARTSALEARDDVMEAVLGMLHAGRQVSDVDVFDLAEQTGQPFGVVFEVLDHLRSSSTGAGQAGER